MNTLFRLINTVFSGEEFENQHPKVDLNSIYNCFSNIPYQLSVEQNRLSLMLCKMTFHMFRGRPARVSLSRSQLFV